MQPPKCPFCFSTDTEVIASETNKEAVMLQCHHCGKRSEIDVENPNIDLNDPSAKELAF